MSKKIVIVGAGNVGSHVALFAALDDAGDIWLYDHTSDRAEGHVMDIHQALSVINSNKVIHHTQTPECMKSADIIVLCFGRGRKSWETREYLLSENVNELNILKVYFSPNPIIIIVTNPVDSLYKVLENKGYTKLYRMVGVDTPRLKEVIRQHTGKLRQEITCMTSGSHDNNMTCNGDDVTPDIIKDAIEISSKTIRKKGSTCFAPAIATVEMIKQIVGEENETNSKD